MRIRGIVSVDFLYTYCFIEILDADGLCGGILTEPNVTLSSPDRDFNNRYDAESDCHWILAAPDDKVIQLVFEHVNMEGIFEESCYYDNVLVRKTAKFLLEKRH